MNCINNYRCYNNSNNIQSNAKPQTTPRCVLNISRNELLIKGSNDFERGEVDPMSSLKERFAYLQQKIKEIESKIDIYQAQIAASENKQHKKTPTKRRRIGRRLSTILEATNEEDMEITEQTVGRLY